MSEKVGLLTKTPSFVGDQNQFISVGIMQCRGDKYMVLLELETGKVYIEEVFATHALGNFIAGFNQIQEDKVWNMMCYAANSLGLTGQEHLSKCIRELSPSLNPALEAILQGINPDTIGKNVPKLKLI